METRGTRVEQHDAFDALFFGHAARMVRLARALHEEADAVDVDVQGLHARTRSRLDTRRASRAWVPLLAVAAVLLVVAGGLVLDRLGDAVRTVGSAAGRRGGVAEAFTCPRQVTVDDDPEDVVQESF